MTKKPKCGLPYGHCECSAAGYRITEGKYCLELGYEPLSIAESLAATNRVMNDQKAP